MDRSGTEVTAAFRRGYILANAFEFFFALAATIAGVGYLLHLAQLDDTVLGIQTKGLSTAWNVMFVAGGLSVTMGLALPRPRLEVAGLIVFAAALLIDAFAITTARGLTTGAAVYTGFAVGSGVRCYILIGIASAQDRRAR